MLLLSGYDAASHRRWRRVVSSLPGVDWTVEALPPRHFQWRVRGNALWWAFRPEVTEGHWDAVLATSAVDLAALRGLSPSLARVPTAVYFHENQLVYPNRDPRNDPHLAIRDLYTALAADRVLFNSTFNRDSLFEGLGHFLGRMPDHVPRSVLSTLRERCDILPVPLEEDCFQTRSGPVEGPLQILWNHRWEHDKAPERFFGALGQLADAGLPFRVHVLGQRFREAPEVFEHARARLGGHVGTWGFVENVDRYRALLTRCDVVVSTALQEFQGLAVLEAMAAGCHALVPNRLAYPEGVPDPWRYPSFPDDADAEVAGLVERLARLAEDPQGLRVADPPDVDRYRWSRMAPRYRAVLETLARG